MCQSDNSPLLDDGCQYRKLVLQEVGTVEIKSLIWCEGSLSRPVLDFFLMLKDDMPIWRKPV